jgi:hypothetical protein
MAHSGEACVATAAPHDRSCSCRGHRGAEADRVDCVRIVHKTANVLNKVAVSVQATMKADLREIHGAPTRAAAEAAIDVFVEKYGAKYPRAAECLTKDREALLASYVFPAEHWDHLRTSNPIESVFATVRHRVVQTKGSLSPPPPGSCGALYEVPLHALQGAMDETNVSKIATRVVGGEDLERFGCAILPLRIEGHLYLLCSGHWALNSSGERVGRIVTLDLETLERVHTTCGIIH